MNTDKQVICRGGGMTEEEEHLYVIYNSTQRIQRYQE